jgi:large subunit ribosomal protein L23
MNVTDVIRRPLITEKTSILREDGQTMVFDVARDHGLAALAHGKVKRQGRFAGRRSDWKKAYVRLRDGEKLPEFLEGA